VLAVTVVATRGRGAIFRDLASDGAQRGVRSLHGVVAASSVDVHVYKPGWLSCRLREFPAPRRARSFRARPYCLNGIFANQDARVVNFCHRG